MIDPRIPAAAATALAAILAVLAPAPARAQQAWPDLTDAGSYTFAGNRSMLPFAVQASGASSFQGIGHVYQAAPNHAVTNIRVAYANFYVAGDGSANPERCPGNPMTVDWATVFVGGAVGSGVADKAAYPVTFGGATSARVGDCEFVWSDPLRTASGALVTIPAGAAYYVRSSRSVGPAQNLVIGSHIQWDSRYFSNATVGDGVQYLVDGINTAQRTAGTVPAFSNGTLAIGPALIIGTGWDGGPVFLAVGDSIGSGQADRDWTPTARGNIGYVARGLDDAGGPGRFNFLNWGFPGTRPQDNSSIAAGQYRLRARLLRSVPNRPYNRIFSEMGQNGVFVTFPQHQAAMRDWWSFWRGACPTCPIYQTTYAPHAGNATATNFWTSTAGQSAAGAIDAPGGVRDQVSAWYRSGTEGGLPPYVTPIDTGAALADPAEPQKWRVLPEQWTLTAAVAANAPSSSVTGPVAPTTTDWYVFEPGTANAEAKQCLVSGTGPWTLGCAAAKAHSAGSIVQRTPTQDGTHPTTAAHKAAAAVIIARKADGTIR